MMNALGLLEVSGLTASIEAADAMLKAAQVRLISQTVTPPGMITLVIEGDLAACRAALDAGSAAAKRLGQVIVRKEIGRPEIDTEWFVTNIQKPYDLPAKVEAPKDKPITPKEPKVITEAVVKATETTVETPSVTLVKQADEVNELSEAALLQLITKHPQGRNVTDILSHFNATRAEVNSLLKNCISEGKLRKRGNRYYIIEATK